jgi:predicted DNA repair protein MutK
MSGLLALLDDVAGIVKIAAANVDDVATQAVKASAKAAGAVIDDAAVTPKYVQGFAPARELPIVGKIAWGSIKNKLIILLPAALLLSTFAPWLITPLLMLGGCYLCFEGAEKVYHLFVPHKIHADDPVEAGEGAASLEETKIAGAVKTDFILSAEIMTIILSGIDPEGSIYFKAGALALAGIFITVAVYGSVALIVKADDVGLWMARGKLSLTRAIGRGIVKGMPFLMKALLIIGTAAMIWVGGSIVIHGMHALGLHEPYSTIHHLAEGAAHSLDTAVGFVTWAVTAFFDGIFGLALGLALIPVVTKVINPFIRMVSGRKDVAHH